MNAEAENDVKNEASSSEASTADVKDPVTGEGQGEDSSSEKQQDTSEAKETLEQVIQDTAKQSLAPDDKETAEGEADKGKDEGATQEQDSEDKEESSKSEDDTKGEEKGPVPYERFAEVNSKFKTLEAEVKQQEPLVTAQKSVMEFCGKHNVTPEQFQFWMDVAALYNVAPEQALKQLQPKLNELQGLTGDKLPDELQEMVNNNEISLNLAKRLAKAETQAKFGEKRTQMTEQQLLQQRQQDYVRELTGAFNTWLEAKKGRDPDFAPKTEQDAPDGKFEFFIRRFSEDAKTANAKTAQDFVALADKSYEATDAALKRFHPKPNNVRVLSSTRSSATTRSEPKNLDEAIKARARKLGIPVNS